MWTYLDLDALDRYLEAACGEYQMSAPTVARYCEDLSIRLHSDAWGAVTLYELAQARRLHLDGAWAQPNYAANQVYHLMRDLGMDTVGHAGF